MGKESVKYRNVHGLYLEHQRNFIEGGDGGRDDAVKTVNLSLFMILNRVGDVLLEMLNGARIKEVWIDYLGWKLDDGMCGRMVVGSISSRMISSSFCQRGTFLEWADIG